MVTISCHLETHLRKLTLVGSLNVEDTFSGQRCSWKADQSETHRENREDRVKRESSTFSSKTKPKHLLDPYISVAPNARKHMDIMHT